VTRSLVVDIGLVLWAIRVWALRPLRTLVRNIDLLTRGLNNYLR